MEATITQDLYGGQMSTVTSDGNTVVVHEEEGGRDFIFAGNPDNKPDWIQDYVCGRHPLPIFVGDKITIKKGADGLLYVASVFLTEKDSRNIPSGT